MFLQLNPLGQAVVIIRLQDRNGRLNQDRAGIQVLGDQVNRATSKADAGLESLANAIKPTEAG